MADRPLPRLLRWLGLWAPQYQSAPVAAVFTRSKPQGAPTQHPAQPPWTGLSPSPSLDGGEIRATILRNLLAQLDAIGAPTSPELEADARFLSGLVRCLGSATLELPVFPDVSLRLDRLLRQPEPSHSEVIELVSQDPDLVRRVWTAAHTAMFVRGVSDLDHAIARIGFDHLWRIGMSACVHAPIFRAGRYQARVERLRAQGNVAARVCAWLADDPRGDAFLAGMLHGAGGLFVWRCAAATGRVAPSKTRVQRVLRDHSAALGVLMAQAWGLGDGVAAGVGFWPTPDRAPGGHADFARLVRAGVVATLAAEEAQAGRDCGGLTVLASMRCVYGDPERILERASQAWRGEQSPDGTEAAARTA